jgi:hypothetical protein
MSCHKGHQIVLLPHLHSPYAADDLPSPESLGITVINMNANAIIIERPGDSFKQTAIKSLNASPTARDF